MKLVAIQMIWWVLKQGDLAVLLRRPLGLPHLHRKRRRVGRLAAWVVARPLPRQLSMLQGPRVQATCGRWGNSPWPSLYRFEYRFECLLLFYFLQAHWQGATGMKAFVCIWRVNLSWTLWDNMQNKCTNRLVTIFCNWAELPHFIHESPQFWAFHIRIG